MDRITKQHRSWNMSRIRGKNTTPEMRVRKFLYAHGMRYRVHVKLPGRPDILIRKKNAALFINGCFWHGHIGCKNAVIPKSNTVFWQNKINSNVERDQQNRQILKRDGWRILTIWECDINKDFDKTMSLLMKKL